jgi:predicted Zn-dependent protease
VWWRLGDLHRFRRERPAAEAAYARALEMDASLIGIHLDLARLRLEAGAPETALAPLHRYLERRPEDPEGWSVRGRILAALSRPAEARDAFATSLAQSAATRPALPDDYLGWVRAAEGAGTPVIEILRGLDEGTQRLHGAVSLEVAALDLAERHGKTDEALARLTRLEAGARRKESWAARRARLLEQAGRVEQAQAAWETVLTAIASLPDHRRGDAAVRALQAEATAGVRR